MGGCDATCRVEIGECGVATKDEVECAREDVVQQVVPAEFRGSNHVLPETVAFPLLVKIDIDDPTRDLPETALRIGPLPGPPETGLVDIRSEKEKRGFRFRKFLPKDPKGIRFLAGGTPRAPGARWMTSRRKRRKDVSSKDLERPSVAEEPGDGDGEEGQKGIPFLRTPAKKIEVDGKFVDAERFHPLRDAASDVSPPQGDGGEPEEGKGLGEKCLEFRHGNPFSFFWRHFTPEDPTEQK